jgi:hypothetical protein
MNSIDGEHLLLSETEQLLLRGFAPSGRPITRLRPAVKIRARCCAMDLAVIHDSQRFDRHLHNGDRLTARTAQVPRGRPKGGNPPFTMRGKCADALPHLGPASETDKLLFRLWWNDGHGYRRPSIRFPSPYLWSFSYHCSRTNFVDTAKYSAQAVSAQCGAGVLLRPFAETGMTLFVRPEEQALFDAMRASAAVLGFTPSSTTPDCVEFPRFLNTIPGVSCEKTEYSGVLLQTQRGIFLVGSWPGTRGILR